MSILCTEEIQDVIGDFKYELEIKEITVGLQQVQHHDVVKLGTSSAWWIRFTHENGQIASRRCVSFLKYKPIISLQACKINDSSYIKSANDLKFKVLSRNKPKTMVVHVETVSPQQDLLRRAPKIMLPRLDKDLHDIELRLVLILSYKTDENMAARLK